MNTILENLKSWQGLTSTLGSVVPGFTFFIDYAPPLFKEISLVTSALAVMTFIIVSRSESKPTVRRITTEISISFFLLIVYLTLFKYTTIETADLSRHQIGFHTFPFSLTQPAKEMISQGFCPAISSADLLRCVEGSTEERINAIWGFWVIVSGVTLIALFVASSLLWVRAFCSLAKK